MLVKDLPIGDVRHLEISDTVQAALDCMQADHVRHLAITRGEAFEGICAKDQLQDEDPDSILETLAPYFIKEFVREEDHFLSAVSLAGQKHLTVIPVLDANGRLTGCIEAGQLLKKVADFLRLKEPSGMIVLEMDSLQYSFSEISRIIEANDAQITQLNTNKNEEQDTMEVTVFVNKIEISDIVASFQRHGYSVNYYFGEELYNNELKDNYENLMNYLNV